MLQVSVRLSARVGETEPTLGELTSARAGDVLTLDREMERPIDLILNSIRLGPRWYLHVVRWRGLDLLVGTGQSGAPTLVAEGAPRGDGP